MAYGRYPSVKALLQTVEIGSEVVVKGWVRSARRSKQVAFIALNDGSCFASLQIVVDGNDSTIDLDGVTTGAAVEVTGELVASPGQGQRCEVQAKSLVLTGAAGDDFPLQKKRHTFEYLRSIAYLRPRANTFGAVFRLRSALSFAVHQFFKERDFLYVHTPIITANDCEGAGEVFRVTTLDPQSPPKKEGTIDWSQDFFAEKTGLTVSGQLQGEMFACAMTDIYTFGPTFRAENSNTSRHMAEFWMIEPEIAFANLADDCQLAEDFLRYLVAYALENCGEDLQFFNDRIEKGLIDKLEAVVKAQFTTMTYAEAVSRLQSAKESFQFPAGWGKDLQSEHERYLTEKVVGGPLFVVDWPQEIKAFYMRQNDDGKTVAAMDLLLPKVGELIGGSQREERMDILLQKMETFGIDPQSLPWYLDLRRWGSCPHAGFGLGFERLLMYLSGMENIRDVIACPRTPGNAKF